MSVRDPEFAGAREAGQLAICLGVLPDTLSVSEACGLQTVDLLHPRCPTQTGSTLQSEGLGGKDRHITRSFWSQTGWRRAPPTCGVVQPRSVPLVLLGLLVRLIVYQRKSNINIHRHEWVSWNEWLNSAVGGSERWLGRCFLPAVPCWDSSPVWCPSLYFCCLERIRCILGGKDVTLRDGRTWQGSNALPSLAHPVCTMLYYWLMIKCEKK